jgi:hypothetical protein
MEVKPGQLERLQVSDEIFLLHKRNKEFLKNLKVEPVYKFIQNYRANWKDTERTDSNRIPNKLLHCRPHGKRSLGRPLKRWSETVTRHLA